MLGLWRLRASTEEGDGQRIAAAFQVWYDFEPLALYRIHTRSISVVRWRPCQPGCICFALTVVLRVLFTNDAKAGVRFAQVFPK